MIHSNFQTRGFNGLSTHEVGKKSLFFFMSLHHTSTRKHCPREPHRESGTEKTAEDPH